MRRSLVALALVALCAVLPSTAGANVGPPAGQTQSLPGALVWGTHVFTKHAAFVHWLHKRHKTLAGWRLLHPRAMRILSAAEIPVVRFRPSQLAPRKSPRPVLTVTRPVAGASSFSSLAILLAVGLALIVLAALPTPAIAHRAATVTTVCRIGLLAVGLSVVTVIAVAKLAG